MTLSRVSAKPAFAAKTAMYAIGTMDQSRSTHEYSRVMTERSQALRQTPA